MEKKHLLVVDDDGRLRDLLKRFLHENGYLVSTAEDASEARALMDAFVFDLAILDVMMPGETGFELTESLREGPARLRALPILMLTAMGEVENRIEGLTRGADDYLPKPFDPRELLLRIQAILRRQQEGEGAPVICMGEVSYDRSLNRLMRGGDVIPLTTSESQLLSILLRHTGETLTREDLMDAVEGGNPRTVDVQITRLRRKLEDDSKAPRYLQTIRGRGYTLIPDPA